MRCMVDQNHQNRVMGIMGRGIGIVRPDFCVPATDLNASRNRYNSRRNWLTRCSVYLCGRAIEMCATHQSRQEIRFHSVGLAIVFGALVNAWSTPVSGDEASVELAKALVVSAGQTRGVCAILGCDDQVALEVARASEMLIHVWAPEQDQIRQLRHQARQAGMALDRFSATAGEIERLPYADNMIDLVVVTNASARLMTQLDVSEVMRVLRPEGVAIIGKAMRSSGGDVSQEELQRWSSDSELTAETPDALEAIGTWIQLRKPIPANTGEWTHWEHAPDNNPVSQDQVIQAPYLTQFLAHPMYIGMPSITTAAGGRTFLAVGHIAHHRREWSTLYQLIARNGYNGAILWQRKLPEGYLVHRSAFIATRDAFYMIDGDHALVLDPATGVELRQIQIPGVAGDWKWMAKLDNTLFVMAGPPDPGVETVHGDRAFGGWSWADLSRGYYGPKVPFGYGITIAAYDLDQQRVKWQYEESDPIDSRSLAMIDGKLFLHCPDKRVRCLAADSGRVLWTNEDPEVQKLIAQPGRNLTSTPGFRTQCLAVATPEALIIQGQTRMNVIALSTDDGYLLWKKKKVTNNPNAIYVDGKVVLGVGENGRHVMMDPVSGNVEDDLMFHKAACTRLTACADSFFCRGEGTLRFDRETHRVLVDGAQRPGCNDGAIPAHGLLYMGPWQCDCNLSLIGLVAKCSAGDLDVLAEEEGVEKLQVLAEDVASVAELNTDDLDWPTYRGDIGRSSSSKVAVANQPQQRWTYLPQNAYRPTPSTAAGGLVFTAGDDGVVRAIQGDTGQLAWEFMTGGAIKYPPTIWQGRAFVGSSDGCAYALEAATGRLLWRFRAAPRERLIMVYDSLSSTWPVNTGVMVHDGTAYFAAGIIDQDGTFVFALDAVTGQVKWQNSSCGHLNPELRKGVSAQGNLSMLGDQLLMAGGNQVSPAVFDMTSGECRSKYPKSIGQPTANNGKFIGVFDKVSVIAGGRILYASPRNVSNKNSFVAIAPDSAFNLNFGGVPPAWNGQLLTLVNFKHGKLTALDAAKVSDRLRQGLQSGENKGPRNWFDSIAARLEEEGAVSWQTDLGQPDGFEVVSLAVCPNSVIAVLKFQDRFRARSQWFLVGLNPQNGQQMFQRELPAEPLPGGLTIDRHGNILVTALNGAMAAFGRNQ
jgi:outer membrane protein assembly factor BamB/SAM-dependent methyltransferase